MKLYLHCGYHKTGSSFLQTMFAKNRGLLKRNGIWFPSSEREKDMLAGRISPGNGVELTDALSDGNAEKAEAILTRCRKEAEAEGCDSLLFSSEGLFHAFEKEGALSALTHAAKKSEIGPVSALIYFRDPVGHVLSVYKHRGKRGTLPPFMDWLNEGYETLDLTESFLDYRDSYPITWNCRAYRKDSEFMAQSAFTDWLGTEIPEIPENDTVNESLTLTEIELLRVLHSSTPGIIPYFTEDLRKVPLQIRKGDRSYERFCEMEAAELLEKKYIQVIEGLNRYLPDGEKLQFPDPKDYTGTGKPDGLFLKKEQIQALAGAANHYHRSQKMQARISLFFQKVSNRIQKNLVKDRN
jgi:hypothetical protein